jgi:hypothetical protein
MPLQAKFLQKNAPTILLGFSSCLLLSEVALLTAKYSQTPPLSWEWGGGKSGFEKGKYSLRKKIENIQYFLSENIHICHICVKLNQ